MHMIINGDSFMRKKGYTLAAPPNLSTGASVRVAREMLEMSQNDLSRITGMSQATISGIEKNRIKLGVERAKVLAVALHVHPAVLLFPDWETEKKVVRREVA